MQITTKPISNSESMQQSSYTSCSISNPLNKLDISTLKYILPHKIKKPSENNSLYPIQSLTIKITPKPPQFKLLNDKQKLKIAAQQLKTTK